VGGNAGSVTGGEITVMTPERIVATYDYWMPVEGRSADLYKSESPYDPTTGDRLLADGIDILLETGTNHYDVGDGSIFFEHQQYYTIEVSSVGVFKNISIHRGHSENIPLSFDHRENFSMYFKPDVPYHIQPDDHVINDNPLMNFTEHVDFTMNNKSQFTIEPNQLTVSVACPFLLEAFKQTLQPYIRTFEDEDFRLNGKSRLGLSWDAVANMMNVRLREEGIGLVAELAPTKSFRLRHLTDGFFINGMSYNFAVLLGFYGMQIEYPIHSQTAYYFTHYTNLPPDPILAFSIDAPVVLPILDSDHFHLHSVIPYTITTASGNPPLCRLQFTITEWFDGNDPPRYKDWCAVDPATGVITMVYQKEPPGSLDQHPVRADVKAELFQGDAKTALFTRKLVIYGTGKNNAPPYPDSWQIHLSKRRLVFDEKVRVGLLAPQRDQNFFTIKVLRWIITDRRHLRFSTAVDTTGYGIDDARSCVVQALHYTTDRRTPTTIQAQVEFPLGERKIITSEPIEIISDQVEYAAQVIEAPYVGFSLSTPQLYLLANIGYQMFKNSLLNPRILDSVQVAAVLQNTFSAGMYMSGGGDFPITMNDADSANLTFTLCDANYHPIKLLSPMYVILKVEPAPNPVEDISQWNQMLPRVRRPQVQPLYHQIPRLNIFEHPDLLTAWMYPPDIM
jgi:hypothetical protein